MAAWAGNADNLRASSVKTAIKNMGIKCVSKLLYTGRHFWNRKCRKKTWWQQEFAVFKCEATANSVTGHVCVNSNEIKTGGDIIKDSGIHHIRSFEISSFLIIFSFFICVFRLQIRLCFSFGIVTNFLFLKTGSIFIPVSVRFMPTV